VKQFPSVLLMLALVIVLSLQPLALNAQEETTPEAVVTETAAPTEGTPPTPTTDVTDEPTSEATVEVSTEPTLDVTATATTPAPDITPSATATLSLSAPPAFNLTQTTFDAQMGVPLEISLSVSDEAGIVRVVEDVSATLGGVSVSVTEPTESAAPFNTGVSVTYLAPADFSGVDSFTLNAIDGAGETASVTISVNVASVEATAELTAIPEDGVMAATTFTVNNNNDVNDGVCNTAHCSLREAINASNSNVGKDTIAFSIGTGVQTIQPTSELPEITDPVIIDGTTQPGFAGTPIIEIRGDALTGNPNPKGIYITAGSSTIRGLVINRFVDGYAIYLKSNGDNIIQSNFIGTNVTGTSPVNNGNGNGIYIEPTVNNNLIGGTVAAEKNLISGNSVGILLGDANIIQGNFIGVDVTGTSAIGMTEPGSPAIGILIYGDNNMLGGTVDGAENVISGYLNYAIQIENGAENTIQGNLIGTTASGTAPIPESNGIWINNQAANNIIGGSQVGAGNIIATGGTGINIESGADGTIVQGNFIGTDPTGTLNLGNGCDGIQIFNASNTLIGGTQAGEGNIIAYSGRTNGCSGHGIQIIKQTYAPPLANNNRIQGNRIFSNKDLGIELVKIMVGDGSVTSGPTVNDSLDADVGANNHQNYPVLIGTTATGNSLTVGGTLNSEPNKTYRIEFFSNSTCDPSGYGEGETYLGFTTVVTNSSGDATINTVLNAIVPPSRVITATATDPDGNTSEFSPCQAIQDLTRTTPPMYPPSNLAAVVVSNSHVDLTWLDNSDNENNFLVERTPAGTGNWQVIATLPANSQSYSDISADCDAVYDYRVAALRLPGFTAYSNIVSAVTVYACAPITQAPTLNAPPNGGYLNDDAFTFTWNAVNSATSYQLQIDNQANFSNPFVDVTVNETEYDATGLDDEVRLYWRVRAGNVLGFGPWSRTYNFWVDITTPTTPLTLTHPLDGSFTFDTTPAFSWSRPRDAKKYQLVISTSDTCEDVPLFTSPELTRNAFTLAAANALPVEDTYFWCVRYADAAGNWSDYSQPFNFDLTLLKTPVNGSATTDKTPTLTWNRAPGTGVTYDVLLDTDPLFASPETIADNLSLTRFTPTSDLAPDTYYWRVLVNGGSWNVEDEIIWSFLVTPTRLAAPVITAPAANAFTNDSTPLIDWNPVSTISGVDVTYEIQWDDDLRFRSPESAVGLTASPFTINPTLPDSSGQRYAVRVRAVYDDAVIGAWSRVVNFTLDTTDPGVFTLTTPTDGSSVSSQRPTFRWTRSVDAVKYEIQLSTTENFSNPSTFETRSNTFTPPSPLLATTYWWRVRAFDRAGNDSGWAGPFDVIITSALNAAPMPNLTGGAPTLTWGAVTWAAGYAVQVDNDPKFTSPEVSDSAISANVTELTLNALPDGTYFWRVRAKRADGRWGAWANDGTFTIDQTR
jgi:CSLREA domain-containing protein